MKKILSLILALMMIMTSVTVMSASAAVSTASITIGSDVYKIGVGDTFTYSLKVNSSSALAAGQLEIPVDFAGFSGPAAAKVLSASSVIADTAQVQRFDSANKNGFTGYVINFVNENGYNFSTTAVICTLSFKVLKAGSYNMTPVSREVIGVDDTDIVDLSGNVLGDSYRATVAISYLATPKISSVAVVLGGVTVKWGAVDGAVKYRIYRKVSGGSWAKLVDTTALTYTDKTAKSGTAYYYTVRCISADGSATLSSYDSVGTGVTYIAAPAVPTVTNVVGGVSVKWLNPGGAAKYRIFRKTGTGAWAKLADTTALSYTDKTAKSGTKYAYTVRCLSSDGKSFTSAYNTTGSAITYVAAPTLSSVTNVIGGVTFKWVKPAGAVKFRIFRKTGSGAWTRLADTTAVSYTDKKVTSGTKYTYSVRCISSDAKTYTSAYDTTGKVITYVAAPVVSSVTNVVGGVTVKWAKVTGAAKYRIYRKTGSGAWKFLTDTAAVSYTDKTVKSGTKYSYTVRCLAKDGKTLISAYNTTGKAVTYIAAPVISKLAKVKTGVQVTWGKVAGAAKYRIYRKVGSGAWKHLTDTTAVTYTDKTVKKNTKYGYTVRCISKDGKTLTSGYNTTGKSITYK